MRRDRASSSLKVNFRLQANIINTTVTLRVQILKDKFSQSLGLPFKELLPSSVIEQALSELKIRYYRRLFEPIVTLWAFFSQVIEADKSIASAFALGVGAAIALTPTSNDDGLLTPAEIIDLKINAELVVLSACDTGRGKITGDGVVGLSRSLITAGASSVIVSLWAVPDSPTSELMTEFYQQWQKNPDKAAALRNAMLETMKKHPQPRDWAAFTLIGES